MTDNSESDNLRPLDSSSQVFEIPLYHAVTRLLQLHDGVLPYQQCTIPAPWGKLLGLWLELVIPGVPEHEACVVGTAPPVFRIGYIINPLISLASQNILSTLFGISIP